MKSKHPPLVEVAVSMPQAVASWGIPVAVLKSAKKAGCPAFESSSRIRLATFLHWFFESYNKDAEQPPDGLPTWRDALNRVQTKREEIRLAKDKGQVLEFDEARRQASEAAAAYFAEIDRMCRELPPVLKGLDEVSILKKLESRREEIRAQLNSSFDSIGKTEIE